MGTIIVDPCDETPRVRATAAARLDSLTGKRIALLDISKPGGSAFLQRIEGLLKESYGVEFTSREVKPTFAKPAPKGLIQNLVNSGFDAVIEALAD